MTLRYKEHRHMNNYTAGAIYIANTEPIGTSHSKVVMVMNIHITQSY